MQGGDWCYFRGHNNGCQCRKQALRSAAAAGHMQPRAFEEEGGVTDPIDEPEIRSEAMAVGLIAADRLASLLLHNSEVGPRPGLKVCFTLL